MTLDEAKEILERFELGMSVIALVDADSVGAASLRARQCEIRSEAIRTILATFDWTPVSEQLPEPARRCWMNVDGKVKLGGMLMMTQILPPCEKLPPVPKWRYVSLEGHDLGGVFGEVTAWQYFYEPQI